MAKLELDLLDDEVKLLRTQVSDALKDLVQYETSPSRADPKAWDDAKGVYARAREVYLRKARELAAARRRLGLVEEPSKADAKSPATAATATGDDHSADRKTAASNPPGAAAAVVGSIDIEAVLDRSGWARRLDEQTNADRARAKERLATLQAEARAITAMMNQLEPGSADHRAREKQLEDVKARIERERQQFQQQITGRHGRESARLMAELQGAIAAVATARGLDYVVRVPHAPQPDADPTAVLAALNRSVLYASARNDITEEVVRELNRRSAAADERP
jgi:Skp family chaperone for outer membrane proteins